MNHLVAIMDSSGQLEALLPWAQVLVSMLMLGLTLWMWRARTRRKPEAPDTVVSRSQLEKLEACAADLRKIAEEFSRFELVTSGPIDSKDSDKLRGIIDDFDVWLREAKSHLSRPAWNDLSGYQDQLVQLWERLRELPLGIPTPHFEQNLNETCRRLMKDVLRSSDQDIDRARSNRALQRALDKLARSMGMELICPESGSMHVFASGESSIRVGTVLTRGLRYKGGKVIQDPDIREMLTR